VVGELHRIELFFILNAVQQLDVRVEQAVFFLTQVSALQRQNTHDVGSYSVRYTKHVEPTSFNLFD